MLEEGRGRVQVYNSIMPVKNIVTDQNISSEKLKRARDLRSEMTPAEKVLWQELRGNKVGLHFRRQQVIAGFIVDFYCHSAGLVIELDGDIHMEKQKYDAERDKVLEDMGLRVVRYVNDDVLFNLPRVLSQICELLWKK
jgi:very-short-patch-repair endonuclease